MQRVARALSRFDLIHGGNANQGPTSVKSLPASPPLARALAERNYHDATPVQTAVLAPGQTAVISFRVRRLYKNPSILNGHLISIRSNADNLTRSYASVQLQ